MSSRVHPTGIFLQNGSCAKCGSKDISNRWLREGDEVGWRRNRFQYAGEELINRHCRNCHYEWAERPLDKMTVEDIASALRRKP